MSHVLLVEDDDDLRESLQVLLERRGYKIESAADGVEALQKIRPDDPPGLILLDLMMPVMDGWEVRARLLSDPQLAKIPVVLLSGVADLWSEARSLQAVDYLLKPVDLRKVYRLVSRYCD
jgi:CheY-like chemotaxis protein